jgi:uncharacterized membrane protein (UPF0127 family)
LNIKASFKAITPFLLLLITFPACPDTGPRVCTVTISSRGGRAVTLVAEIADTEPLRQRGLMHRRHLAAGRGMMFVFQDNAARNFWMHNTYLPLSIAYIGRECVINEIYDMKPLDISVTYPSSGPARYALEVNRGWFEQNDIGPGCRVDLHGCVGQ